VGGFILFGGEAASTFREIERLRQAAGRPLLLASDLERGAGQQFAGATRVPPPGALGVLGVEESRRAGEITGREASALGIDMVLAPVADLDVERANPIVGTRAFGARPADVADRVRAWIEGCHAGGALCCPKHFPGHGRSTTDSHLQLPVVGASRESLAADILPFRAAVGAGADAVMTAHVAYPELDPEGGPATLSHEIVQRLLRDDLGFEGLVVTDALDMKGITANGGEPEGAVRALASGCDVLLHPSDVEGVVEGLRVALDSGRLSPDRASDAVSRLDRAISTRRTNAHGLWGDPADLAWAVAAGTRSLRVLRGDPGLAGPETRIEEVDDDTGPSTVLTRALAEQGIAVGGDAGGVVIAVLARMGAGKGRAGLGERTIGRVNRLLEEAPDATVLLFAHPRTIEDVPRARNVLGCWIPEPPMFEAAASWLRARR
jgi:beta-glucosidase-like glycosyl hydrolase